LADYDDHSEVDIVDTSDDEADAEPAAEVDAVEERHESRPVGRPFLKDPDLTAPAYGPVHEATPHSVGDIITHVLKMCAANRATQKHTKDTFDAFRMFLPPGNTMPNLRHARRMAEKKHPLRVFKYAACPQDCTVLTDKFADLHNNGLLVRELRCADCKTSLTDAKHRIIKV
jgi:hypothetical protein